MRSQSLGTGGSPPHQGQAVLTVPNTSRGVHVTTVEVLDTYKAEQVANANQDEKDHNEESRVPARDMHDGVDLLFASRSGAVIVVVAVFTAAVAPGRAAAFGEIGCVSCVRTARSSSIIERRRTQIGHIIGWIAGRFWCCECCGGRDMTLVVVILPEVKHGQLAGRRR